jgi:uncharacterized membrane protein
MVRRPDPATAGRDEAFTSRDLAILAGITLLAAVLRLCRLDRWSLWVDEAHTLRDVTCPLDQFWGTVLDTYPLSYLMLRGVLDYLPSYSEGWLRLPFAFFGILAVPVAALAGRGIVGRRASLFAAIVLAVHPWALYWSQNARAYALMLPFAILGAGALWSGTVRRSWVQVAGGIAAIAVAGLCHPTAWLLLAAFAVHAFMLVWNRPGVYRPGVLVWSAVLVGGGVVAALIAGRDNVDWFLAAKSRPSIVHFAQTSAWFFRLPLLAAAVAGLVILWRADARAAVFTGAWALVPLAVTAVLGATVFQVTAQYVYSCLPALCLLTGVAVVAIADRAPGSSPTARTLRWVLPVVLIVDLLAYDALYFTSQHGDRPRWREGAAVVTDASDQKKLVLTTNLPSLNYYLRPDRYWSASASASDARIEVVSIETWDIASAGGGADFMRGHQNFARGEQRELWVVAVGPELAEKDVDGTCEAWLRTCAHQVASIPAWVGPKEMTVLVWRVPTPPK